jgi:uncharacterized protein
MGDDGMTDEECWRYGLDLFDQRYLWEAHEVLEGLWHRLPKGTSERDLVQAIILAAGAVLKRHMGDERSSDLLVNRAIENLVNVGAMTGRQFGIDTVRLTSDLEALRQGGPWPTIRPAT